MSCNPIQQSDNRHLMLAAPVLIGAIVALLSRSIAAPGDVVVLETVGVRDAYVGLAEQGPTDIFLASDADPPNDPCDPSQAMLLGRMMWNEGVGKITFVVPNVPSGVYSFHIRTPASRPDCWRIGEAADRLTLTVQSNADARQPANGAGETPSPSANVPVGGDSGAAFAIALIITTACLGMLARLAVRRRRSHRPE
jgi:hypothetical protein